MSILLSIPTELCNFVLAEWLLFVDWGKIDLAVCNRLLRPYLLDQFKLLFYTHELENMPTKLRHMKVEKRVVIGPSTSFWHLSYNWISLRRIQFKHLNLHGDMLDKQGQLVFPLSLNLVENLLFNKKSEKYALHLIDYCPKLKILGLRTAEFALYVSRNVCGKLHKISFDCENAPNEVSVWAYIRDACRSLRCLDYKAYDKRTYIHMVNILKLNPHMERINLTINNYNFLKYMDKFCKHLREVELKIPSITVSEVIALVKSNKLDIVKIDTHDENNIDFHRKDHCLYLREYVDTDENMIELLSLFPGLHKITLDGMSSQTDSMMNCILNHSASTLTSVGVGLCPLLSNHMLKRIFAEVKRVEYIDLFHGELTNEDVLDVFSISLPKTLQRFYFHAGVELNTITIINVLTSLNTCEQLEEIHFSRVPNDKKATQSQKAELESLSTKVLPSGQKLNCYIEWVNKSDYYD